MEPQVVSESRIPNTDRNVWKVGTVAILIVAVGVLVVTRAEVFFVGPTPARAWSAVALLATLSILGTLAAFFVKRRSILAAAAAAAGLLPVVAFSSRFVGAEFPTVLVAGFVCYALLLIRAFIHGAGVVANSVTVRFFPIARATMPRIMTAALLFMSFLGYLHYARWGGLTPELRAGLTRQAAAAADPVLHLWFPGASLNQTGGEFFEAVARRELPTLYPATTAGEVHGEVVSGFRALAPALQEKLVRETAAKFGQSVESVTGPLDPRAPLRDSLAAALAGAVSRLPERVVELGEISVALLAFASLKGFAALSYWLLEGLAFLVYQLLLSTGFAKKDIELRSREFVSLP